MIPTDKTPQLNKLNDGHIRNVSKTEMILVNEVDKFFKISPIALLEAELMCFHEGSL